jgi:hypothetical protein
MLLRAGSHKYVVAATLNFPLAEVEPTLTEAAGYGTAPYVLGAYGRCKAVFEGDAEVVRRVSLTGQMTYRRQTYCLGRANRGGWHGCGRGAGGWRCGWAA